MRNPSESTVDDSGLTSPHDEFLEHIRRQSIRRIHRESTLSALSMRASSPNMSNMVFDRKASNFTDTHNAKEILEIHEIAHKARVKFGKLDQSAYRMTEQAIEQQQVQKAVRELLSKAGPFHLLMHQYVDSKFFSGFILLVILLNTAMLIAQTFEAIAIRAGWYFQCVDSVFLGIYVMEAVIKIFVWERIYFRDGWNILDFTIVLVNVFDFMLPFLVGKGGFSGAAIFRLLRIFRSVRALRALRVLRTIRFLSNLQVIMNTCLQSMQSMGAIVGLMTLFIYMFAVIGTGLYRKLDPDRFGNVGIAAFTLFQLLTLDDWFYIYSDAVDKDKGAWHIFLFLILYIIVEYFVFLNLFVAVLVDNFQLTLEESNRLRRKKSDVGGIESDSKLAVGGFEDHPEEKQAESDDEASDQDEQEDRHTVHYYYDDSEYTYSQKEMLGEYMRLLCALEHHMHLLNNSSKTLDLLTDVCMENFLSLEQKLICATRVTALINMPRNEYFFKFVSRKNGTNSE